MQTKQFKHDYTKRSKYSRVKITAYFDLCLVDTCLEVGDFLTVTLLKLFLTIKIELKCFLCLLELSLELLNLAVTVLCLGLD